MSALADLVKRFHKDERGVFLVIFAVLGLVLVATSGAVVDFSRVQQARTKAQNALDAATLALSDQVGEKDVTADTIKAQAQLLLTELVGDAAVTAIVTSAVPDEDNDKLTLNASITVPTYFVQVIGIKSISASMLSEVTRSSSNLEVAVAADITYSMSGSRITALKSALTETIDLLVKTDQKPTYSKMAIVPYSNGVNVGTYADAVRGAIVGGVTISSVTGTVGSQKTMTGISKASQAVVASNSHGFLEGDYIYVSGVAGGGFTAIAEGIYRVGTSPATNSFKLMKADNNTLDSSGYTGSYTASSGKMIKCLNATCKVTVTTSGNHNYADTDIVLIKSSGATYFNNKYIEVSEKTETTFVPKGVTPLTANIMGTGGTAYCTKYGCSYYRFTNKSSVLTTFQPTECAVERTTSTYAYLDTSPATSKVGIQYAPSNGVYYTPVTLEACPVNAIQPLTPTKKTLTDLVDAFVVQGSTAGHIGLAWAWYLLSPDFTGGITGWPTISAPAAWDDDDTIKAIILMTDGEFNTMYDYGVPSSDADYVNTANQSINAAYATSLTQASKLCTEIKMAKYHTLLYVVGFGITDGSTFDNELEKCATKPSMYKTASDAATLKTAFKDIADSLSQLRVSK